MQKYFDNKKKFDDFAKLNWIKHLKLDWQILCINACKDTLKMGYMVLWT